MLHSNSSVLHSTYCSHYMDLIGKTDESFVMTSNFIMFAIYKVIFSQGYDSNTVQCGMRRKKKGERKEEGKII